MSNVMRKPAFLHIAYCALGITFENQWKQKTKTTSKLHKSIAPDDKTMKAYSAC